MDWQFFATIIGLFTLLDLTAYAIKRREQLEYLAGWNEREAESKRRHDEFMAAMRQARRTPTPASGTRGEEE